MRSAHIPVQLPTDSITTPAFGRHTNYGIHQRFAIVSWVAQVSSGHNGGKCWRRKKGSVTHITTELPHSLLLLFYLISPFPVAIEQCDYRLPVEAPTITTNKIISTPNTWSRGAYQCLCKRGYYSMRHPDGFNGTIMEIAWKEHQDNVSNYYSDVFTCLKCAPGCDFCMGPEPCLADYNWPFRWVVKWAI